MVQMLCVQVCAVLVVYLWCHAYLNGPPTAAAAAACTRHDLKNGRVRLRQKGRLAKFFCTPGYMLAGDMYSTCILGEWENEWPRCVRATCSKVQPPENGLIFPSHNGAVLHFYCSNHYVLHGTNITYCDGLQWDAIKPTCLPTNHSTPLVCDFEAADLCGWSHDLNHDFDWRRLSYRTPSGTIGTGPHHDHTKGSGADGHYMYIESSARSPNDTARLISPMYLPPTSSNSSSDACVQFAYHMFGPTTGTLRLYVKLITDPWPLSINKKPIFSRSGNQGNHWYMARVRLPLITKQFQLVFEGVRGSGYTSDIAIDDIALQYQCQNKTVSITTSTLTAITTNIDGITSYLTTIATTTWPDSSAVGYTSDVLASLSCKNRCGNASQSPCSCADGCFEQGLCCVDYLDLCAFATTEEAISAATKKQQNTTMKTTISSPSATTRKLITQRPLIFIQPPPTTTGPLIHRRILVQPKEYGHPRPFVDDMLTLPPPPPPPSQEAAPQLPVTPIITVESVPPPAGHQNIDIINAHASDKHPPQVRAPASPWAWIFTVLVSIAISFTILWLARRRIWFRLNYATRTTNDVRYLTSDDVLHFAYANDDDDDDDNL